MISDWQIQRRDDRIILGLAVEHAVLDVVTDISMPGKCLSMLEAPHQGLIAAPMGHFGDFPVTLNLHQDEAVSIFIDGPDFGNGRRQSAAIWVGKNELCNILKTVLNGS
jgi:hypothetical protein